MGVWLLLHCTWAYAREGGVFYGGGRASVRTRPSYGVHSLLTFIRLSSSPNGASTQSLPLSLSLSLVCRFKDVPCKPLHNGKHWMIRLRSEGLR